nr:glycosyltransferase family A protein [uncultured Allomuricauda sp.]
MLTFVIPVKSKSVSNDWVGVCQLLETTLKSICNQTDSNYEILVVCHEIPEINYDHEKLHFIHPDFPPPLEKSNDQKGNLLRKRIDKGDKVKVGVAYAVEKFNTDYVMLVDSDDFISNRISEFVNNSGNDLPGWFVGKGYLNLNWKYVLLVTKQFNYLCGSSVIVKPNLIQHFFDKGKIDLYLDHRLTKLAPDIELKKVPFSAAIYNMRNGENIWMSTQNVKTFGQRGNWLSLQGLKRMYGRLKNYQFRFITPGLRKEFNF